MRDFVHTLGLVLLVGAKGDFEQYLQPPFKIYFITTQMDKLTEGERARAHSAGRTHAPTAEQWGNIVQAINAIADPATRLFTKAISTAFGEQGSECCSLFVSQTKGRKSGLIYLY